MTAFKKIAALFAVAVFTVFSVSACNLFLSDEEVINKMMIKMANVDSYSSETQITGAFSVEEVSTIDFSLLMTGKNTSTISENEENLSDNSFLYNISGDIDVEGQTMAFGLDLEFVKGIMYLKLNSLPMNPMLDLGGLQGVWYSFDFSEMEDIASLTSAGSVSPDLNVLMAYASELYEGSEVFSLKKDLGTEKVNNNRVYHFSVDINKEALVDLLVKIVLKSEEGEEDGLTEKNILEAKEEMLELLDSLNFNNFELFIDKSDFSLRRVIMDLELAAPAGAEGTVKVNFDSSYDNFNESFEILVPTESKTLEELIEAVLAPLSANAIDSFIEDNDIEIDMEDLEIDMQNLEEELTDEDLEMLEQFLEDNPTVELETESVLEE